MSLRIRIQLVVLAFSAGFLPSPALAQKGCKTCGGTGEVTCRTHRPPVSFDFKHSLWLSYECCLGTGKKVCPKCKADEAVARFEKRRMMLMAWVEERRTNVDACLFSDEAGLSGIVSSGAIRHAESGNFRLVSTARPVPIRLCDVPGGLFADLPSKSPKKQVFSPEHFDWILLKRCEDAFVDFKTVFKNQGSFASAATNYHKDLFKAAEGKYDVFLWDKVAHHMVCGRKFFGSADDMGVYKHATRLTTTLGKQNYTRNDEMLHRYLTHMLHHLFLEAYKLNIGYDIPAWVPEGFAHYMEWKKFGNFKITCYFERSAPVSIPSRVKNYVLKLAASKKGLPASSLIQLNYNTMDTAAHAQIWSLFHFLIEGRDRDKFILFIQKLKHTRDQMKAFKEAYGYSILQVDEPWREFVLKTYR